MTLRVLVCGGRDFDDYELMKECLGRLPADCHICHGDAPGADKMAAGIARSFGMQVSAYPARWSEQGKRAGPIRNQHMLDDFKPKHVLAFPTEKSIGTWDMVRRASRAGVKVEVIER